MEVPHSRACPPTAGSMKPDTFLYFGIGQGLIRVAVGLGKVAALLRQRALGGVLEGVRLVAHHSFAAEFDGNKPIRLIGTLTKAEWQNPHSFFYIDVKDEKFGRGDAPADRAGDRRSRRGRPSRQTRPRRHDRTRPASPRPRPPHLSPTE